MQASSCQARTRTAAPTRVRAVGSASGRHPRIRRSTGYIFFTMARQRRVVFRGRLQPWVGGKDIVLELLRRWGAQQSQGMSVELVDAARQLPMVYRNTIANMMAEAEALNGIFAPDEVTDAWYRAKGLDSLPYPALSPGPDATYAIDETLDLTAVRPMIAKPFSPGNAFGREVARGNPSTSYDRLVHQRQHRDLLQGPGDAAVRRPRRATFEREVSIFRSPAASRARSIERRSETAVIDRRSVPLCLRQNPPILVRPLIRTGTGADIPDRGRSPRSTATGKSHGTGRRRHLARRRSSPLGGSATCARPSSPRLGRGTLRCLHDPLRLGSDTNRARLE